MSEVQVMRVKPGQSGLEEAKASAGTKKKEASSMSAGSAKAKKAAYMKEYYRRRKAGKTGKTTRGRRTVDPEPARFSSGSTVELQLAGKRIRISADEKGGISFFVGEP